MPWTLVFANDQDGNGVEGDIATLIRAVRYGRSVKVVLEGRKVHQPLEGVYTY